MVVGGVINKTKRGRQAKLYMRKRPYPYVSMATRVPETATRVHCARENEGRVASYPVPTEIAAFGDAGIEPLCRVSLA